MCITTILDINYVDFLQYTFPELHNYDVTQNFRIIFKAF